MRQKHRIYPIASRLDAAQSQHEHKGMRRCGLKTIVFVKTFCPLMQRMHQQGSNARIVRHRHGTVDGIL